MSRARASRVLRFADRYAGIPLLFALGLRRKYPAPVPASVRRIGLLRISAIGDMLMLAGVLPDVRRAYPDARIVLISGQDNREAAALLAPVDERLVVHANHPLAAARAIRAAKLDILVDFGPWPRLEALLSALSAARYRVGFCTAGQARHFAYDATVEHLGTVHEMENYRRLVAAIGVHAISPAAIAPPRTLSPDRLPRSSFVVFHPWAGGFMGEVKQWPLDRWISLAEWVASRGWTVVLSGGPGDRDRSRELASRIRARRVEVVDAAGTLRLTELADLLSDATAVVSVNTGVMHLSALVGAPTVSLQGPTSVSRWGPIGPRVRPIASTLPGCGYLDLGFEYAGERTDCMSGITVGEVTSAIDELVPWTRERDRA